MIMQRNDDCELTNICNRETEEKQVLTSTQNDGKALISIVARAHAPLFQITMVSVPI